MTHLTNGVILSELDTTSLFHNSPTKQVISAVKTFKTEMEFRTIFASGLVDGITIQPDKFVTLDTSQYISNKKTFNETFSCENIIVNGK